VDGVRNDGVMCDSELYRHLLGLVSPWEVSRVELSVDGGRVDVWTEHPKRTRFACPECGSELSVYDHAEERAWRHLDSRAFLTYLHASPPRVECPTHGVRQVTLPWAEPMSRFTVLFERLAIDVLKECDVEGAARLLRLSWDEAWHLMDRAVARGLAGKPHVVPALVGVDEKAAGRGQGYITVVSNLETGTVEHLADERRQTSLDGFFENFSAEERTGIAAVAMDMWDPYISSTRQHLEDPETKIVFDRYHLLTEQLDGVPDRCRRPGCCHTSSGDQRRRGGPQLAHPGHPGLRSRLSQPGAFQDRDLVPPRWTPALPGHPMTWATH